MDTLKNRRKKLIQYESPYRYILTMVIQNAWIEMKIVRMTNLEDCWTINGKKKTCARLAMADEPAKNDFEVLQK